MTEWINGIAKLVLPTPFKVGDVNAYLIQTDRLTLVDCAVKTEEAWQALQQQLRTLGLTPKDIDQVVLTHHHPDHVGLLDYLPKSLPVYGHPKCERWVYRTEEFFKVHNEFYQQLFVEFGIPEEYFPLIGQLTRSLRYSCNRSLSRDIIEGDIIPGLEEWQIIETPGHAQGHIALLRDNDGVLIGGDHVLAHISPNPLLEPPSEGETERPKPLLQYNHSLKKLLNYSIKTVYTGHGDEVYDLSDLVDKRLKRQHERAMSVKDFLHNKPLTVFEICQLLFPTVYQKEFSLTISETVGQVDYLISIGEIDKIEENKTIRYTSDLR
jgi:glyoxylase-like metal-dependent hydrolase (beta-lactamase superfamily II)